MTMPNALTIWISISFTCYITNECISITVLFPPSGELVKVIEAELTLYQTPKRNWRRPNWKHLNFSNYLRQNKQEDKKQMIGWLIDWLIDWLIVWCLTLISTVFDLYWGVVIVASGLEGTLDLDFTLSQTTNFRPFQTQKVCRRQL